NEVKASTKKKSFLLSQLGCYQQLNVAVRGTATQSSMYGYCYGSNAIDGNRNSNFHLGSCSCTAATHNPWWRVDLLQKYNIYKVVITNRGDCCPERINGAEIRIGNFLDNEGNNNPRCGTVTSISAGASTSFYCNGMVGRYVNVVIPGRAEYLTLCEVEVYAVPLQK
uniref:Fucolectin tachylectin-4 pentraxin-1 domain-containing protein n=1 Tax=Erpetoichthys calabaricus TaxID=27687 RepID=A0A8C4SRJ4_ERPCA